MILLKVLTFNVDSNGKIKDNIIDIQKNFKEFINDKLSDDSILCISFQEDTKKPILLLDDFIKELKSNGYKVIINSKGLFNFHIHSIIITKLNINLTTQSKRLNIAGTKNYIINRINIDGYNISFISTHLPIDTSDKINLELGYQKRKNILDELLKKFVNDDNIVILAGDLNFRINENGIEQLTKYIEEQKIYNITEIFDINKFGPTCKINPKFKTEQFCLTHFTQRTFDPKQIKCELKCSDDKSCQEKCNCKDKCPLSIQCYDKKYKRIPSYCDRVLAIQKSNVYTIKIIEDKTQTINSIDKFSDHNAVYVEFNIEKLNKQEGGYYYKYLKYKQKYLNLKRYI